MKTPASAGTDGGGGTNHRSMPSVSGKAASATGVMGTGSPVKAQAKGCMGSGNGGPASCKGTMGKN